jgi:tRNA(Ile)-lysidine synthase
MPVSVERSGIHWVRPWLAWPREAIEAYVRRYRLKHIEDDSNADVRHARNRLRLQVWPALQSAFPSSEITLAESAAWAQEARLCLDELAQSDLASIASAKGLCVRYWLCLSLPRRSNALRAWLHREDGEPVPASLVKRLMVELPHVTQGVWIGAQGQWRCHRGYLRYARSSNAVVVVPSSPERTLHIKRAGRYPLPGWGGSLQVVRTREQGVPLAWLAQLELRARQGGERFQAGLGRPPRSLKKQFQAAGISPWDRDGPLVFSGGQLVFVPGLGLDARILALPGQPQVTLCWVPDTATAG